MTPTFTGEPVVGAIRGYRWWRVSAPGRLHSAWLDDEPWAAGSNEARCAARARRIAPRGWARRHLSGIPSRDCTCGFYGLHRLPATPVDAADAERPWLLDPERWSGLAGRVVFGVAEAWGHALIGTEGWRARYCRPLALFVPKRSDLARSARLELLVGAYGVAVVSDLTVLASEWGPEPPAESSSGTDPMRWNREDPEGPGGWISAT